MMRLILTTIILTMLAQPVWAGNLGPMYRNCKAFADAGYNLESMRPDHWQAIACVTYVGGVVDIAQAICTQSPDKVTRSIFGIDPGPLDLNAVIKNLIKFAEENPQYWGMKAVAPQWTSEAFPCKR